MKVSTFIGETLLYDVDDDDPRPEEARVSVDKDGDVELVLLTPGDGHHYSVLSPGGARELASLLIRAAEK